MTKKYFSSITVSTITAILLSLTTLGCSDNNTQPNAEQSNDAMSALKSTLNFATQTDINNIASTLDVKYRLVTNVPNDKCDPEVGKGSCFTVELSLTAEKAINVNGWSIFFSHISPIQGGDGNDFAVKHLNGDLHEISLKEGFSGFKAGEMKKFVFRANHSMISETDALPNYIVTAPNLDAQVIESTKLTINAETGLENFDFVVPFNDEATQFKRTPTDSTQWLKSDALYQRNIAVENPIEDVSWVITPTPKSQKIDKNNALLSIAEGVKVNYNSIEPSTVKVALERLNKLGVSENAQGVALNLSIEKDDSKLIGSYALNVTTKEIQVVGVDETGVFNGLQSLASLVTLNVSTIPVMQVKDEPHYLFRGMLVDVARNFHSKEFILALLDQMAAYKLNKLHLHLGDDEGWRLEIPSLPELTDIGSKRCFDTQEQDCLISQLGAGVDSNSAVNGYYSVSDYTEILQAATARHIQVIPSLDMPGHSRSSVKAMQARYNKYMALEDEEKAKEFLLYDPEDTTKYSSVQYYNDNTMNVCMESSYAFITEVMTQVQKIHVDAGQPLTRYHIGADETAGAWVESPICQEFIKDNSHGVTDIKDVGAYFIERVAGILSDLGIETAGWSDGMSHTRTENMPAIVQANAWDVLSWAGHNKVNELANRNWQIVISTPDALYFDFPYEASPKEFGYYWAARQVNTEKVFQFMPDNLPIHAEFWLDRENNAFVADDTKTPMAADKRYLGIQGQLWSENTRTDDIAEHKVFPRLLALAERAWYLPTWAVPYNYEGAIYSQETSVFTDELKAKRDENWRLFANTLGKKEFAKLELDAVDYRLPTVGAIIENGLLKANIAFPGLTIEYQDATQEWQTYSKPVAVKGSVSVRSRSHNGTRASRTTVVQN